MFISCQQNARQKINKSFGYMAKFKYFEARVKHKNYIYENTKSRLISIHALQPESSFRKDPFTVK
jgi:hypothetical protein